jgi:hypothetical protein
MSSLSPKDRVSLCQFSFADGRRCRTPRTGKNPHFCFDHAQKEARAHAADTLGQDLAYFFSGNYLSACDLSTALARLIPAVVRGDVKPKTAHTVAYLMQTLLQAIHVSQHEYGEAFGGDGWRQAIRNSVNHNLDYRFPPAPRSGVLPAGPAQQPEPPGQPQPQPQPAPHPAETPVNGHSPLVYPDRVGATHHSPLPQAQQTPKPQNQPSQSEIPALSETAPSPHTPLPATSAAFAQRVVAGLQTGQKSSPPPKAAPSSPSATLTPTDATPPAPPQPQTQPPAPQPAGPEQGRRVNPREPDRSAPWLEWGRIIPPDSKLL